MEKTGYSIIGQGKIDEILSNKSEDRRDVFEEAAGIVKFKTRKEESEKKLEHTKLNVLRINDILSEIETNLEPLKIQNDKAKKYLDLKQELKNIEVGLFVYNIENYKNLVKNLNEDYGILQDTYCLEEKKLNKIKDEKEEQKNKAEEIALEIENAQNYGFTSKQEIETLNSNINISKSKIENNDENKNRLKREIEEINKKISTIEEDINLKSSKKIGLKENKQKYEKELEEKENQLQNINKTLSKKALEIEQKKRILENNIDLRFEIENKINEFKINIQNYEKRKEQVQKEITNYASEIDNKRFENEDLNKSFHEIQKNKNSKELEIKQILGEKENVEGKIKQIDNKINYLIRELNFKETKYKFLQEAEKEKEGYQRSVKLLLQECEKNKVFGNGVEGTIAELIDVPENLETAIEMALAGNMQNIVTKNENDAKQMIDYLRKNNLGRASFLPITTVKGRKIESIKGKKDGFIGVASDLIKYDKTYTGIMENLLGRTVIVENMEKAIIIAKENGYAFRIVTLDGDIVNTSGSMSGGSVNKKTINILGRNKQIENLKNEIHEIKLDKENLENEKEKIISILKKMLQDEEVLKKDIQTIEIKFSVENQKVTTLNETIKNISNKLNILKKEKEELESLSNGSLNLIEDENKKRLKIEDENLKLKKIIDEFSYSNKDVQKQIEDLNFDITNLKISVSSFNESEGSIDEMIVLLQREIESHKKNLEDKQNLILKMEDDQEKLKEQIKLDKKQINKIEQNVQKSSENVANLKEKRMNLNLKLKNSEKEEMEQFKRIEDLKEQIIKLEVKKGKLEDELNNEIALLWDEYELTPNNVKNYTNPENISKTTRIVKNLREDIKKLGNVNVDSIEEYKKLKQRYDFMCEQRLDLENTMAKLRQMINEITEKMKVQFKEKMEIINRNFDETFKELFGGGEAKIILQDEANILECGIDIIAEPPGKKLQSMALLSGGEKAFTAIALLFGILKMNPAPFCVLDEIEAALDDINVNRYAAFLKKFAIGTQFLVITHRKGTMEAADTVYGITMEEKGISKLLSMKLKNK